ncbi:MAG: beta-ketoacyl-ACP synthase 3 [Eubacteriales bacterium]
MGYIIIGTGSAHPQRAVTNGELSALVDTSDEWIYTHTGIRERRVVTDESMLDLAYTAASEALRDASLLPADIDTVIFSTFRGDYLSPSMSVVLSGKLGIEPAHVVDSNMACPGFIYALDIADSYFKAGKSHKTLVVAADILSRVADWHDRSTCVLFGDGAGAVVLAESGTECMLASSFTVKPAPEQLSIGITEGNSPFRDNNNEDIYLKMNGQEVFKFAVSAMCSEIPKTAAMCGLELSDIDCFLLHQANMRIIESARRKLGLPAEKLAHNIESCGNTSSACIPMMLDVCNKEGRLKAGDKLLLCAFGAGLVTGTCVLEWHK